MTTTNAVTTISINFIMKIPVVFLVLLLLLAGTDAASTSSLKTKPLIGFEDGRLSVKAGDVPLKDLLSDIQERSGIVIEFKDSQAAEKRPFVDFNNLLPVLAFRAILQDLNFAFFYSGARLARVLILPSGEPIPKISGLMNPNRIDWRLARAGNAPLNPGAMPNLPGERIIDSRVLAKLEAIQADGVPDRTPGRARRFARDVATIDKNIKVVIPK